MIATRYICDKCGNSQETSSQMFSVGVVIEHVGFTTYTRPKVTVLWCRKCTEEMRLLERGEAEQAKNPLPPAPTLEDMIREIVQEEIINSKYSER